MKSEEFISKLQQDLNLSRFEVIILLANTLAEGILSTHSTLLSKEFESQPNRLVFRKLKSVLNTLQMLNFLRF